MKNLQGDEPTPIICGTDLSESAQRAATVAAAIARRLGEPLILLHADESGEKPGPPGERLIGAGRAQLISEMDRLRANGASVEERFVERKLEEGVARYTKKHGGRMVVVASSSSRAGEGRGMGGISEEIAETASWPTLVVRDSAPLEAWARGERPLKIFVGMDFSVSSDTALRWVAGLREIGPCEVAVGYVDWPIEEAARLGVPSQIGLGDNPRELQEVLERDLRERAIQILGDSAVNAVVRGNWGRVDMPLVEMAAQAGAELLVVGTHQVHGLDRLRHPSISRGVLRHAPMNVACVPKASLAPIDGPRIRECKRVLVAVDLGKPHHFAVSCGYSIVQPGGGVRLVHNIVPLRSFPLENSRDSIEAESRLRALEPREARGRGITTEVEITRSSQTAEAICAAAERLGADVICVGSYMRPGIAAKALGSVSLAVLQASRRPVLTVWSAAE